MTEKTIVREVKIAGQPFVLRSSDVVHALRAANADLIKPANGERALIAASGIGDLEVVQFLLNAKVDANATDTLGRVTTTTALMSASEKGHLDVVRALLDAKADVNATGILGTALMVAAQRGHLDVVKALLDANADVNVRKVNPVDSRISVTALTIAKGSGHNDIAELLHQRGGHD